MITIGTYRVELEQPAATDPLDQALTVLAQRYPAGGTVGQRCAWIDDLQLLIEARARSQRSHG